MLRLSKKQLFFVSAAITLATYFSREGNWSNGFVAGTGRGFPWFFWREVTRTDVIGYVGRADRQVDLILGGAVFLADTIFWFILILLVRLLVGVFLKGVTKG